MADKRYDDSSISQLKGAERVRLRPEALMRNYQGMVKRLILPTARTEAL